MKETVLSISTISIPDICVIKPAFLLNANLQYPDTLNPTNEISSDLNKIISQSHQLQLNSEFAAKATNLQ